MSLIWFPESSQSTGEGPLFTRAQSPQKSQGADALARAHHKDAESKGQMTMFETRYRCEDCQQFVPCPCLIGVGLNSDALAWEDDQ